MNIRPFYLIFLIMVCLSACSLFDETDDSQGSDYSYLNSDGLFLLNEGNFMSGNGSLSYYSFYKDSLYNDLFEKINGRPLGDIPNSMTLKGNLAFIVVNNSGKIEVTERTTLKSVSTIRDLISPRNILAVGQNKAFVTSLLSEKIAIIDLDKYLVTGYIDIRRTSEALTMVNNKVFISCWSSGDEIMVVDPLTNKLTDSIKVGNEPESMVVDKNQKLWVLCSGGYSGQYYPELIIINSQTDQIERVFQFPSKTNIPSSLCINSTGDTLYYIERGLRRMCISDTGLPTGYFVQASGRMFYKLAADWHNGGLFATNAVDYQQKGYLLMITSRGEIKDSSKAGIIPASLFGNKIVH